jgi:two-component system chemotaxis sensor kinase CheA
MSDFAGMEDLLQDFLVEAGDLLSEVDNKLVELEHSPDDPGLLNDIFRGFHTIKGGAGFLGAAELVTLCHLTESLFDKLRKRELAVTPERMDVILSATGVVRDMFVDLGRGSRPGPAAPELLDALRVAIEASPPAAAEGARGGVPVALAIAAQPRAAGAAFPRPGEPDWDALFAAVAGGVAAAAPVVAAVAPALDAAPPDLPPAAADPVVAAALGRRATDLPGASAPAGRREGERQRDNSIRVDTSRLDQVLNLSGEIGLTKNRLNALRSDILAGRTDTETLQALDLAVSQLDLLVSDLQNAVMKTRMQPIGRLFHKYPRIARDLARNLGKEVELALVGEETEIDKTMVEDLADPIIHLIRNAVDHGVEDAARRAAAGKPAKSVLRLEARQEGDHIVITVADDGRGMDAEKLRAKALAQGLISEEEASTLDERQSYNLIFLPGFSTAEKVSDVSGRGVGMDVVRTNIQKLNGTIEIQSQLGKGTTLLINLPLTLAILPVLLVRLGEQPFAVPLSMVREILPVDAGSIQDVGGRATMVVRGEVLPIVPLSALLGWPREAMPQYGVVMQSAASVFILAIDSFAGREDAVIKSLEVFRPKGVAGVTTLANGQIVLILDMKELLEAVGDRRSVSRAALFEPV